MIEEYIAFNRTKLNWVFIICTFKIIISGFKNIKNAPNNIIKNTIHLFLKQQFIDIIKSIFEMPWSFILDTIEFITGKQPTFTSVIIYFIVILFIITKILI